MIITSIFILLAPSSSYAQFSRGGFRSGRSNFSLGWLIAEIFSGSPYDTASFAPVAKSHGVLHIKITKEDSKVYKDAEIYVDDRSIGLVRDFSGSVIVSVPSGDHVLELRFNGLSAPVLVPIAQGRTTTIFYSFNAFETK